jgi:hypothetical protein
MRITGVLGVVLLIAACADSAEDSADGLTLERTEQGVSGRFEHALGTVEFKSQMVRDQVLEIEYRFNGMAVTMTADYATGILEADGFSADGQDTQILQADRDLMNAFAAAIEIDDKTFDPLVRLQSMANMLGDFPTGKDLKFQLMLNTDRGSASLCWALNTYQAGTHDGWFESNWSDKTTIDYVYVSWNGPCRAGSSDSDAQTTNFWNGSWTCSGEPDHSTSIEYAYGDCFGRCGSGCGGGAVFSYSCLDHDVCNRFGHSWAASVPPGHCADEFANAAGEMLTEPSC